MLNRKQVLDRYFSEVRAWLIQTAAVMDRADRAGESSSTASDARLEQYKQALDILASHSGDDRAERIQLIFSDPYRGND